MHPVECSGRLHRFRIGCCVLDDDDAPTDNGEEGLNGPDMHPVVVIDGLIALGVIRVFVLLPICEHDGEAAIDNTLVKHGDSPEVPGLSDPPASLQADLDVQAGRLASED
mmetsp:Transcript_24841/g.72773  ORF Transcript_24841/g.72773 Transcript_24841/m.72773 type:complete len:110 (-) Transcript_24841:266-595(-)